MSLLKELWAFVRTRKKFWLLPIIIVLAIFGTLTVLASTADCTFHLHAFLTRTNADFRNLRVLS